MFTNNINTIPANGLNQNPEDPASATQRSPYGVPDTSYNVNADLPLGQLDLSSFSGHWDSVDGIVANSYLPPNFPPHWPLGAAVGDDPCTTLYGADKNKNMDVSQLGGGNIEAAKEELCESSKEAGRKVCPSIGCVFSAKTKRDVERHNLAIHKKAALFFCEYSGCSRKGGWSRKDLRDRHEKTVHGRQRNGKPRSVLAGQRAVGIIAQGYWAAIIRAS
ncbi:hypothetical protein NUW58_g9207 [Xylaria curta]|uniref:Uncharacterized protein n=1 Tax=Xylaria curta TaxID=42375 RepID=A0ACC1N1J6_9PEZI|nr:hypothetical protein NUW58_g9207 [Xylaria curta]